MALEGMIQANQIGQDAAEAFNTAYERVSEALGIYGPSYDPAQAIYDTAVTSGDWETMMHDIEAALAAARVAARLVEDYVITQVRLSAAENGWVETIGAVERAHATASDTTEQGIAASADKISNDILRGEFGYDVLGGERYGFMARIDFHVPVDDVIKNFENAAWNAARIAVGIDTDGAAAFKDSIRESCR